MKNSRPSLLEQKYKFYTSIFTLNSYGLLQTIFIFHLRDLKMGSCLTAGVCCCCSICCNQLTEAFQKLLGTERVTKLYYIFLVVVFVVPSIFIFFFLYNWTSFKQFFGKPFHCPNDQAFQCIGASAVYRLSLSLLVLFLIMTALMLCRNICSQVVNEGLFFFKYLLVVALFIGFLFVSNSVFQDYAIATKYISIFYMIVQSIILIDLFYLFGIRLVKRYDQGQTCYAAYLIIFTLVFEATAIFLNIYGYVKFSSTQDGQCTSLVWLNVITSVIILALPIFQFCQFNPQNSLLTTSLVTLYVSYLSLIAQFSYDGQCNFFYKLGSRITKGSLAVDIGVSTLIFILSMYGSTMGGSGQIRVTSNGDVNKAIGVAPQTPRQHTYAQPDDPHQFKAKKGATEEHFQNNGIKRQEMKKQDELTEAQRYTNSWDWVKWHFYMLLASIYIAVLITNWNSANVITKQLSTSGFSFWVRVVISWVTVLIYIWTLIAPKVLPQRDFNVV